MRAALNLEPLTAEAYNDLAWSYLSGRPEEIVPGLATMLAEKAVRLHPTNWYYRNSLGVGYYRLVLAASAIHPDSQPQPAGRALGCV